MRLYWTQSEARGNRIPSCKLRKNLLAQGMVSHKYASLDLRCISFNLFLYQQTTQCRMLLLLFLTCLTRPLYAATPLMLASHITHECPRVKTRGGEKEDQWCKRSIESPSSRTWVSIKEKKNRVKLRLLQTHLINVNRLLSWRSSRKRKSVKVSWPCPKTLLPTITQKAPATIQCSWAKIPTDANEGPLFPFVVIIVSDCLPVRGSTPWLRIQLLCDD
jgi:hypothetical protein